jgi:hypothetical protein
MMTKTKVMVVTVMEMKEMKMMYFVVNSDYNDDDDKESNDSFILIYFGCATKPEYCQKHLI